MPYVTGKSGIRHRFYAVVFRDDGLSGYKTAFDNQTFEFEKSGKIVSVIDDYDSLGEKEAWVLVAKIIDIGVKQVHVRYRTITEEGKQIAELYKINLVKV